MNGQMEKLSTNDAIAIFTILSSNRVIVVAHGDSLYQCDVSISRLNSLLIVGYSMRPGFENNVAICIKLPEGGQYNWQEMRIHDMLDMLETEGDKCEVMWEGCFNITDIVMGGATVFETVKRYYMHTDDIPNDEFEHAVEIPYKVGMRVKPHPITPNIKSANKQ